MTKVVTFTPKVNQDVIERLEELLQRAKEGEITSLAYATVTSVGCGNAWVGDGNANLMCAAISQLNFQYNLSLVQESYEEQEQ